MHISNVLLGAAVLYGISRMARETSLNDVRHYAEDLSGVSGKDVRKYALKATDEALLKAGLRRAAAVPSPTGLVLGGAAGGLLVGAVVATLLSE